MTFAYLPAKAVLTACRDRARDFEPEVRDVGVEIWRTVFPKQEEPTLTAVRQVAALAEAAGAGEIAVSAEDFQLFAKHYPRDRR